MNAPALTFAWRRSDEATLRRRAAIAFLALVLALLAGYGVLAASQIRQREQDALDAHLAVVLQAALSEAASAAAQAQQEAATLAERPALQRALAARDRAALAGLTANVQGASAVPAGSPAEASATPALRREVRVLAAGRLLGTVTVSIPLDGALLMRLRTVAPLRGGEGFLLARGERILEGPRSLDSSRLSAKAQEIRLSRAAYRVAQAPLVGGPGGVRLAALAPAAELDQPVAHAERLLVASLLATLMAILLLAPLLARPVLTPLAALVRRAHSSATDELTQLPNRRAFVETATRELGRARRSGRPVAVAIVDVDDFKRVNDDFGHAAGDRVLQAIADVLRDEVREFDLPSRYGGEEFAILLPETTIGGAQEVAERLRRALAGRSLGDGRSHPRGVTASVGVASAADRTLDELVDAADRALYRAKRAGKNQVATAE